MKVHDAKGCGVKRGETRGGRGGIRDAIAYNPQNEMFAAFETNRSLLKNETYPKFKKFSPGFAGV